MEKQKESQENEKKATEQQGINDESLAKEIPTVTPEEDNLEPSPDEEKDQ